MGVKVVNGLIPKSGPGSGSSRTTQSANSSAKSPQNQVAAATAISNNDATVSSVRVKSGAGASKIRSIDEAKRTAEDIADRVRSEEEDIDVHTHLGSSSAPREHFY